MTTSRLLIVGNPEEYSVGHFFEVAARELNIETQLQDVRSAYLGSWAKRQYHWLFGRVPSSLTSFSDQVVLSARKFRPTWVLTTGIAPLTVKSLETLRALGAQALNFLTDDPWNRNHYPPWFLPTLPLYEVIHTPRKANSEQLRMAGCRTVVYTPFAYCPTVHYPETQIGDMDRARFECDVFFAGGADRDRVSTIKALINSGCSVGLYGGYWNRFWDTRQHARGILSPAQIRSAVACSKIHLGLVRRTNRDGQSMRTYELAAMGACMVVEDTAEHRELFGREGTAVSYFANDEELVKKVQRLLGDEDLRKQLSRQVYQLVTTGAHTYKDRLRTILGEPEVASIAR